MARAGDGPPARRRSPLLHRAGSAFTFFFTLFSLTPATPRNDAEGEGNSADPGSALNRLVLGLTFLFVLLFLAASSAFVVYAAWTHDLQKGALALVFAVVSGRVAMNWLIWKDEAP